MKVPGKACKKYIRRSSHYRWDKLAEQQFKAWLVPDWMKAAVRLVDEIGLSRASSQLGIPVERLYDWVERVKFNKEWAKNALAHAKEGGWLDRKVPQRPERFEKKLREFLLSRCDGNEKLAKQALAIIKNRGLGTFEMFTIADEMKDWERTKRRDSAKKNWDKALASKKQKANGALEDEIRQYSQERKKANAALGFR